MVTSDYTSILARQATCIVFSGQSIMRSCSPRVEQPVDSVITTDVSVNCAHPLVGVAKLCSGQAFVYECIYVDDFN